MTDEQRFNIIRMILRGVPNSQIANALGLRPRQVSAVEAWMTMFRRGRCDHPTPESRTNRLYKNLYTHAVAQISHLPKGWRWLKFGERAEAGDYLCDPRAMDALIVDGWIQAPTNYPVRTKRKLTESDGHVISDGFCHMCKGPHLSVPSIAAPLDGPPKPKRKFRV